MTKPFSLAFKQKMLARLTGTDAVSARQLASKTGLRQQMLSRWLQEASSLPVMPAKRPKRDWSIEEKIRILAKASTLTGAELTGFLQREGVLQVESGNILRSGSGRRLKIPAIVQRAGFGDFRTSGRVAEAAATVLAVASRTAEGCGLSGLSCTGGEGCL